MKKLFLLLIPALMLTACGNGDEPGGSTGGETKAYTITINSDGNGSAIAAVDSAEAYEAEEGATVTLTATPKEGYLFGKWTADNTDVTFEGEESPSTTFTMPAGNVVIGVKFVTDPSFDIFEKMDDPAFKAYCAKFDANKDGVLSVREATLIKNLQIASLGIESLAGIEYFHNLQSLTCNNNSITSLDLSGKENLTYTDCRYNKLTSLDVSGCAALTELNCLENELTSLDLSGCVALGLLSCGKNLMTSLDLSECTALTTMDCTYNRLTTLDVSQNGALSDLWCHDNRMSALDISNMAFNGNGIYYVYCGNQTSDGTAARTLALTLRDDQKPIWDELSQFATNTNVVVAD